MASKGNKIKQKRIGYSGRARILKKAHTWLLSANPGASSKNNGVAIAIILRDILNFAKNLHEVKYILNNNDILVNGKRVNNYKLMVDLFDILFLPAINKKYLVYYNTKGFISLNEIDKKSSDVKIIKILNKTQLDSKKIQVNLSNGYNIITDKKDFKVKDSVVFDFKANKIKEILPFNKGSVAYVTDGPHVGKVGEIKDIYKGNIGKKEQVLIKTNNESFRTISNYVVIIPKNLLSDYYGSRK